MFEKFTQKAIDVVQSAQNYASQFCHNKILSQHLLMGLVVQLKGVQAKILNFDSTKKINTDIIKDGRFLGVCRLCAFRSD